MIFGPFERMVAARYLRARRKEGFVSVIVGFSFLGIALGVATLIIVMAVMNGLRHDIMDRFLTVNDHIDVSAKAALADYGALAGRIRQIDGVIDVTPFVEAQALIKTERYGSGGAVVRGLRPEDLQARLGGNLLQGSVDALAEGNGILIGNSMAETLGLRVGDEATILSSRMVATAFGTVPRKATFTVAGVFHLGEAIRDSGTVFMPLELAQRFFRYPDQVTTLTVRLADRDRAGATAAEIATLAPDLRVHTWEENNEALFTALRVERNVMFLILLLIIVVAAFNIVTGLIMMVKDKGRDIAILRTMGATRGMILRVFLLAGTSVGVVGTLLGFIFGAAFCLNIDAIRNLVERMSLFSPELYYFAQMPAVMEWHETLLIVVMSLLLSLGATIYPSWRAAGTDPIEALRYE